MKNGHVSRLSANDKLSSRNSASTVSWINPINKIRVAGASSCVEKLPIEGSTHRHVAAEEGVDDERLVSDLDDAGDAVAGPHGCHRARVPVHRAVIVTVLDLLQKRQQSSNVKYPSKLGRLFFKCNDCKDWADHFNHR